MGQKTNLNATRLNIDKNFLSKWYSNKANYSSLALEDNMARFYVAKIFGHFLSLGNIVVKRIDSTYNNSFEYTQIIITSKFPALLKAAKLLKSLNTSFYNQKFFKYNIKKRFVQQFFILIIKKYAHILSKKLSLKYKKNYKITFFFVKNKFTNTNLIANYISNEILKKKNIVSILKNVIRYVKKTKILGIFIQVSGRLHGAERAKTLWARYGIMPMQTFSKNIFFTKKRIKTRHGIIGIKIHLY